MEYNLIKMFCSTDPLRNSLSEPINFEGKTYATNCHYAVEVELQNYGQKNDVMGKKIAKKFHKYDESIGVWEDLPVLDSIKYRCDECNGAGVVKFKMVDCKNCEDGTVYFMDDASNEYSFDCQECDGNGEIKETSKDLCVCSNCWGSGLDTGYIPMKIGNKYINKQIIAMLHKLDNCKIQNCQDTYTLNPSYFKFNGGRGIVMPLRVLPGDKYYVEDKR